MARTNPDSTPRVTRTTRADRKDTRTRKCGGLFPLLQGEDAYHLEIVQFSTYRKQEFCADQWERATLLWSEYWNSFHAEYTTNSKPRASIEREEHLEECQPHLRCWWTKPKTSNFVFRPYRQIQARIMRYARKRTRHPGSWHRLNFAHYLERWGRVSPKPSEVARSVSELSSSTISVSTDARAKNFKKIKCLIKKTL